MKDFKMVLFFVAIAFFAVSLAQAQIGPQTLQEVERNGIRLPLKDDIVTSATTATGTVTFSSSPATGSTFTISHASFGFNPVVFQFYTGTYSGDYVGVLDSDNVTSAVISLATAINSHAVLSALMSATRPGGSNVLLLTYDTATAGGNYVNITASTDPALNATLSGATLTGGVSATASQWNGQTFLGRLETDAETVVRMFTFVGTPGDNPTTGWRYSSDLSAP